MNERTIQIVRTMWDLSNGGEYSVKCYRLADRVGALTPADVDAVLDTGLVAQIPGMGGPSSFRMTITFSDMIDYESGDLWDADVESLAGVLS